ncbi:protein EVI2B [Ictalurus furcatus]|uniref:protein EVI2B n=1 Tax=Ictalurus furcatus TaxID=66913 RepID=UPI002350E3D3|nr:protein EVI2B [Ictalurus furcatus]
MKSILCTCALFLVLPWKLTGETTLRPNSTRQYENTSKDDEITKRGGEPTIFSSKNIKPSLKPNGETTHSPTNTGLHEGTSKDHETTKRGGEPTIFSSKNIKPSLKPNGETTHSPTNTGLHEGTSKDHETTKRGGEPTIFSSKNIKPSLKPNGETTHSPTNTGLHEGTPKDHETTTRGDELTSLKKKQDQYTNEERENVLSSKSPPQTSELQPVTSMSHATYLTHAMTTGESSSSSHLSALPFLRELTQKMTDQITITPLPQNMSEEVTTTRDNQTLHNFKPTNKGLDQYAHENNTRSAEKESFKPQTDISTHFQKTPEVITNQSRVEVQTTKTLITKWSSLPQEKKSTDHPILKITDANGTLDISNEKRNDTATYPLNTSTTTGFSTGLNPTTNTEIGRTSTTHTMDTTATYELTTKYISESQRPNPKSETTHTTQTDNSKTTIRRSTINNHDKKSHPGHIVASLIGSILFIMFVAFVVVLIRNHQMKKKQMENTDWAGPSPFIEGDLHPNLPTINEDGSFHNQESKRFSLYSFLPQRLSKRLSTLNPTDEEVPLEYTQASSTFGQRHVQPLNGNTRPDEIQTHQANSPPAEVSSDSNVPETVSIPPAPENNENIQTTPKFDEIIPVPLAETNSATQTPFEDVDLNLSVDKNTESTSPSDAIHIPSPPPLAQS